MKLKAPLALAVAKRLVKANVPFDLQHQRGEIIIRTQNAETLDVALRQEKEARRIQDL